MMKWQAGSCHDVGVSLESIAVGAARECERQGVGEAALIGLLHAHVYALGASATALPTLSDLLRMGALVDPDYGVVRSTPVTFAAGGQAVDWTVVRPTLERLFGRLDADVDSVEFTKAVLDVHPFRDGNGRVAWLLLNWLTGTLDDPVPLPDFYNG